MSHLLIIFFFILQSGIEFPSVDKPEYLVRHFTIQDGLPVNAVNGIVQDDDGYLYLSTLDGLVRYDGYTFNTYHSGNTDGIRTNRIAGMLKTGNNQIWMINQDGSVTQKKGSRFTTFTGHNDFRGTAIRIIEEESGQIWIATTEGIAFFDEQTGLFKHPPGSLQQSETWAITSDFSSNLFTVNVHGLIKVTGESETILLQADDFPIPHRGVIQLIQTDPQTVWVAGNRGLFRYSLTKNQIIYHFIDEVPGINVWNIHARGEGQFLFNTSRGFFMYDSSENRIRQVPVPILSAAERINLSFSVDTNNEAWVGDDEILINEESVLNVPGIVASFTDREGSLWIATSTNGIFQIRKSTFVNFTESNIDDFHNIYSVIESRDGAIWAGSLANGVYRITGNEITNWNSKNSNLPVDLCRFLFEDRDGTIYASLYNRGLWMFNGAEWQKITEFDRIQAGDVTVEAMLRDESRLLIGTTGPLTVLENNTFSIYRTSEGISPRGVRVIREKSNNSLLLGTNGNGLYQITPNKTTHFSVANGTLSSDFIRDIFAQSKDTVWIATENMGLNRLIFDSDGNVTETDHISEQDGLIKNSLHRIIEDPYGFLWISSNAGIMRVSKKQLNSYADGTITELNLLKLNEEDGMVNREANGGVQNAGVLTSRGDLWFPNQLGLTVLNPTDITQNNSPQLPQPIIEQIELPDRTITIDKQQNIRIPVGTRNFRINFTAPNFTAPERLQFRYKMANVHESWEYTNENHQAVLTNIPAGTHRFDVRVFGVGDGGNVSETSVEVTIPPLYYESTWFKILIAIAGGLLLFGAVKYRTRILEQRENKLQERVEQQTEALKEAAEQKSRFFSGITHELKTPLSLISSPLDDLLEDGIELSERRAKDRLQLMKRNSIRLQNLVSQILDVSRLNSDAIKLTLVPEDIVALTRQVIGQFQSLLEQKKIKLEFTSTEIDRKIYVDTDAWERIVMNLMSNAIRFSPQNSKISVTISNLENEVSFSVKDEGIGIEKKEASKVFDYLYQSDESRSSGGTGIGLYLVKGLVNHMGGEIDLISKTGEGAEFIIRLKKGYEHFRDSDTIVHFPLKKPLSEKEKLVGTVIPHKLNDPPSKTRHILLVEDNDDFRNYLQSVLSEKYEVTIAKDGREGLASLKGKKIDLIISDIMMPNMNGLEFVNNLRRQKKHRHLPVIFLSARALDTDKESGLSSGADVYLTKPIKSKLLLSQIEALLRRENILSNKQLQPENNAEEELVRRVRELIYRHLANPDLSVDILADALYVSRSKLYLDWKEVFDISLNVFIKKIRLEEAQKLIKEKGFNVQEAATAVGYSDPNYFSTSFKKEFGVSPSELMK